MQIHALGGSGGAGGKDERNGEGQYRYITVHWISPEIE
ncbi:hypothetical protein GLA29479_1170 [Lysobacter antibioticus]|nr:hypothetical protein GLA29479_1170 [Lysobacter antibioticus]